MGNNIEYIPNIDNLTNINIHATETNNNKNLVGS